MPAKRIAVQMPAHTAAGAVLALILALPPAFAAEADASAAEKAARSLMTLKLVSDRCAFAGELHQSVGYLAGHAWSRLHAVAGPDAVEAARRDVIADAQRSLLAGQERACARARQEILDYTSSS